MRTSRHSLPVSHNVTRSHTLAEKFVQSVSVTVIHVVKFTAVGVCAGARLSRRFCAYFSRRRGIWTGIAYKDDAGLLLVYFLLSSLPLRTLQSVRMKSSLIMKSCWLSQDSYLLFVPDLVVEF